MVDAGVMRYLGLESKGCFPLEGILRTEQNFSLFVNCELLGNEKFRTAHKIPSSGKRL